MKEEIEFDANLYCNDNQINEREKVNKNFQFFHFDVAVRVEGNKQKLCIE